jgi:hypothetical protein
MKLFPSLRVLDASLRHGVTRAKIKVFVIPGWSEGPDPESSNLFWIPGSSLRDAPE